MKKTAVFLLMIYVLAASVSYAQQSADTWSDIPKASDDRFTNPKSKLYAGPNGWFNTGEVRAEVSNSARTSYNYKAGFHVIHEAFEASETNNLRLLHIDFGTEHPVPGVYQVSSSAKPAQKKVYLSFADVSNGKIRDWSSQEGAGTVTVSMVNGFLYVKCRNIKLGPTGMHNTGDLKNPMTLGFEGAIAPE